MGMLPDIDAEDGSLAGRKRCVLIGTALDCQLAARIFDQPGPAAAEPLHGGVLEGGFELAELAERRSDRRRQIAARLAARVRRHPAPKERMVVMASAVILHGRLNVGRQL